ncbi:MAG TPA: acylphosphatase [Candidatus Omnitrophota bacterium]|nr:acylphosphatase [Candidatus Omnitrophota bacterium]HPD85085.1 acylphosphatase [Candidatus Omnitrophota bacterium]HRZ03943.1 acylphosphatase [Candidatus Omnitrophota bacterium]
MVQAHILYSGTVQGVGFRYTVEQFASELGLSGWVKNLPDGRVEILTQGKRELSEQLMDRIEKHFEGYIRGKDISYETVQDRLKSFCITH